MTTREEKWNQLQTLINQDNHLWKFFNSMTCSLKIPARIHLMFSDTEEMKDDECLFLVFPYPYDENFNFLDCAEYPVDPDVEFIVFHATDQICIQPAEEWIKYWKEHATEYEELKSN